MAAERAQQERDFPWQRTEEPRRATHLRRDRENHLLDRRPLRPDSQEEAANPAGLHAGLPGLPQLLRDAALAIKSAEARVQAAEDQMQEMLVAAEQRVRAAEARAKAAEELAETMERRASEAIHAAERRADIAQQRADHAEAAARSCEEWAMRVRRVLSEPAA